MAMPLVVLVVLTLTVQPFLESFWRFPFCGVIMRAYVVPVFILAIVKIDLISVF